MEKSSNFYELPGLIRNYDNIYIYGAGSFGKSTLNFLVDSKLDDKVNSFIVTKFASNEFHNKSTIRNKKVQQIDQVTINQNDVVLLAASKAFRENMLQICRKFNIENIIEINHFDWDRCAQLSESQYPEELKLWYKLKIGKELNLEHPVTFNDKLQWLKLYDRNPIKTKLADKYLVSDYIKNKIGDKYLVPLLGAWDNFDDIDFDELPDKFVLKCNHGSKYTIIVNDKSKLDIAKAKLKINGWLSENYAFKAGFELQYKDIKPKIIAEKYIENTPGDLWDYKFWCFNGKVENIMFLANRGKALCKNNYDRNWNLMPFTSSDYPLSNKVVEKPDNLDQMNELAEELSAGFPFVRIDLYRLNDGTIKFGEFTFTPLSGFYTWNPESMNEYFGKLIKLPVD